MSVEKTTISADEFEKKVEIEMSYLVYMDRLKKDEAFKLARERIGAKFVATEK